MIYEDAAISAELKNPGASLGHIHITCKQDASKLTNVDAEVSAQMFWAASYAATAVFETLGAAGSNIVLREGQELRMDVFARNPDDGLALQWQPEPGDRQQIESTAKKVKDAFWYIGKETQTPRPKEQRNPQEEPEVVEASEDMRVQHLKRRY